ncbi:SDR family oxidoreductase [Alteribacillus bidgolensis]|uniref:NADP-dependent 3-hydroxy acid dehydrogenase YdfG n=1 Tax=Alteribacillus bidgolensis TaxID=930129 RepID=A0A1G8CFV5_9BACI|nr:SDR family oxidoreductase [Alteribacillus bidgolensis]SDH44268.1 NADP-dependent 3-hydroxy acid dehydrogenase YdfG [Alteribacillus bidgolensis]
MTLDKTVIITGASSGIGEAAARKLTQEGANVVLAARSLNKLKQLQSELNNNKGEVIIHQTDVTSLDEMKQLAAYTIESFGKIDVMFNNAGLMPLSYMKNTKVDEWNRMIDVNIKGVLNGFAAVCDHMLARNQGHIITTSSDAAHKVFVGSAVYSATKHAVSAIMKGLKLEMARTDLRFTAISPGAVATDLTNTITDENILKSMNEEGMPFEPLKSEDVAEAVYYVVTQPENVDINEIVVRPVHQDS